MKVNVATLDNLQYIISTTVFPQNNKAHFSWPRCFAGFFICNFTGRVQLAKLT